MKLLEGKLVAEKLIEKIEYKSKQLEEMYNKRPCLAVLGLAGNVPSEIYVKKIQQHCNDFNIDFINLICENEMAFINNFKKVRNNRKITAIMFQQPLSKRLNRMINEIDSYKDVEGVSIENMGKLFLNYPDAIYTCTPAAVLEILDFYNIDVAGKKVVVVGRSNIVGKPISNILLNRNATVTTCHSRTENLEEETKTADILVIAVGKQGLIKAEHVKNGVIIIDVGINFMNGKIYGDVDFDDVKDKISMITPVPGGVGSVTSLTLILNIFKSFELQMNN